MVAARSATVRTVNAVITATYWEIGRHIVEHEQGGRPRAGYGDQLIDKLSADLTQRFGRGFGTANLKQMRAFYLFWPGSAIGETPSGESEPPAAQLIWPCYLPLYQDPTKA